MADHTLFGKAIYALCKQRGTSATQLARLAGKELADYGSLIYATSTTQREITLERLKEVVNTFAPASTADKQYLYNHAFRTFKITLPISPPHEVRSAIYDFILGDDNV